MKKSLLWSIFFVVLLLAGCAPAKKPSGGGIEITQVEVAVGKVEGSGDQQVVSYSVTLHNTTQNEVTVRWMEPVVNDNISSRISGESQRVTLDKVLAPNASLVASGQFTFDAGSATKSEISSWEPFFSQVTISTEMKLPLPSQTRK
jgi:hypothetical protein